MIWVFGDSWAEGWGLKEGEKRFSDFLRDHYKCKVINLGVSASSMGHTTSTIFRAVENFSESDVVICIMPPDTRWYSVKDNYHTNSLFNGMKEYEEVIRLFPNKEWYTYHHSLFIYSLASMAKQKNLRILFAHNYGNLELAPFFEDLIGDVFLNREKSLVHYLLGEEKWKNNLVVNANNAMGNIEGEYFIPNDNHPNEKGHKFIADLLIEKLGDICYK